MRISDVRNYLCLVNSPFIHTVFPTVSALLMPQYFSTNSITFQLFPLQIDDKIENMFASKRRVKEVSADEISVSLPNPTLAKPVDTASINQANLQLAKKMAERINRNLESVKQVSVVQQAAQAVMQGNTLVAPAVSVSCSWRVFSLRYRVFPGSFLAFTR